VADSGSGCVSATADDKAHTTDDLSIPSFLDRTGDKPSGELRGWRDHLPVHPAANLFPLMSEPELRELGEDIKVNGLRYPIAFYDDKLLDGRNRLDAMELVGIRWDWSGDYVTRYGVLIQCLKKDTDPYDLVLSLNINRRHLTEEDRRDLIAKIIKAKPEASDRAIAKKVKRDHKTVAKVRKKMESTGEVSPVEKRVGADGKKRVKPKRVGLAPPRHPQPEPNQHRATGSAEVDLEKRRAEYVALDAESTEVLTVEDDLVGATPYEFRESFLLRTADAMAFAVYSGPIDKEVIAAAERVTAKWQSFTQTLKAKFEGVA
jgi:hypothetical protein